MGQAPALLLDTVRLNETPEGVDLGLTVAGPVPRAAAFAMDFGIRFVLFLMLAPLMALSGVGVGLVLIGAFLLEWLYPVAFEVWSGATPGKRAMGLAVVHDDGTPIGLPASLVRNLLRTVDFLPVFYGVGLIASLADPDFRRLGDLAAGTLVIHAPKGSDPRGRRDRPGMPAPGIAPAGQSQPGPGLGGDQAPQPAPHWAPDRAPIHPPHGLSLALQQAILAFAERAPRLSPARREELALTLIGRLGEGGPAGSGEAAVRLVLGYGAWLAGGR
jgi:uncharacterized RDD family membrane protein YckC